MKNQLSALLMQALFVCILHPFTNPLIAQDDQPTYYCEFNFMQSKNGDYVGIETDIWKKIHEVRIKRGELVYWALFRVGMPYGTDTKYDYVTINIYDDIKDIEAGYSNYDDWVKAAFPSGAPEKMAKTGDSRDIVWTEMFTFLGGPAADNSGEPGKYLIVNRMQADNPAEYMKMENEIFRPGHKAAAEAGYRKNWWLLQRFLPFGSDFNYNFLTIDEYSSMDQIVKNVPNAVWQKAHPGKDLDALFNNLDMEGMRTMVRSELWQLVDRATSEN